MGPNFPSGLRPIKNSVLAASASIILDQIFSSAPLKPQHHWRGGGGGARTPPPLDPPPAPEKEPWSRVVALCCSEAMADASVGIPSRFLVDYDEWLAVYECVKEYCAFPAALDFCQAHPGTINNRKGGGMGNTLLHQAAFWGVDAGTLETLKELGANPDLRNAEGQTPAEMAEAHGRVHTAAAFAAVFGEEDPVARLRLLRAAKVGDFAQVMPCFPLGFWEADWKGVVRGFPEPQSISYGEQGVP